MPVPDHEARDYGETEIVPRTLLRRVLADLEFLSGFVRGQIQIDPAIGEVTGHPGDITISLSQRLDGTDVLKRKLMSDGDITEDEDLDD